MKHHLCTTTTFATTAVSLIGFFAVSAQTAEQTHSVHQGADSKRTPTTKVAVTDAPSVKERVDAETQSPPGVVGKNWPEPVEDHMRFRSLLVNQLEYQMNEGDDTLGWDAVGWYGW